MKRGFTLAEVMVALLILSVILAASAPIITKKTIRTAGGAGNNPWELIGNTTNKKFNGTGSNVTAMIGYGNVPSVNKPPRLIINSNSNNINLIDFYQSGAKKGSLTINDRGYFLGNYPDLNTTTIGSGETSRAYTITNTIAIGNVTSYSKNSIAIGNNVSASVDGIAIGSNANSSNLSAISIGNNAKASTRSIAIGSYANVSATNSIAIGTYANVLTPYSLAIGKGAHASANNSYVIGNNSTLAANNAILIGHNTTISNAATFVMPSTSGGTNTSYSDHIILGSDTMDTILNGETHIPIALYTTSISVYNLSSPNLSITSDLRLKNLGKEYTSGMDKLNQLKIYNYTFKDEPKIKRVGVIAQELMKVFPNAVSKDERGYYVIRQEDIFYTMVNAIKEINLKIAKLIENIKNPSEKSVILADRISDLDTTVKQQQTDLKNLKRRIWLLKLKTAYLK